MLPPEGDAPRRKLSKARPPAPLGGGRPLRGKAPSVPIVGIGASAGGLEALEQFFRHLPDNSGLAFVVVQHLDPTRKGLLVELLQRATPMKVVQVKDRLRAAPGRVYVIPPNKDLAVLHGVFQLLAPSAPRGLRLPIDFFFRSLAADQQNGSLGVLLSGMGSDGTLGLGAIKEQGGAVFVQSPESAKYAAMPRSAIDAGVVDVVAPVEELPRKIVAYRARRVTPSPTDPDLAVKTQSAIEKICVLLRSQTGHDFSQYKRSTIYRRIERRMGLHGIGAISGYVQYLQENSQETLLLFKELLIGVTSFFRDPPAWEHLKKKVLPALLAERPSGGVLRIWVPGCSSGEEAYSLAIAFKEAIAEVRPPHRFSIQIFATDLDKDSVDRARQGFYSRSIVADVSPERLRRYFIEEDQGFRVSQEIRETAIFATQNLIMDPPFTKLDLLSCRNLLIYLDPELQSKLLPLFHYSLVPGGILFLGSAETLGAASHLFSSTGGNTRVFRRVEVPIRADQVDFPAAYQSRPPQDQRPSSNKPPVLNLQSLADQLLLDRYSPAAVLTTEQGDILYISGRTGKFLEPAAGKANWNIHAMARDGLRYELGSAFQRALRGKTAVTSSPVTLVTNGAEQMVEVIVDPLQSPEALRGMVMVVFAEGKVTGAAQLSRRGPRVQSSSLIAKMDEALRQARQELRTTREDMQTSQEELKSANEELQSTNEELQSTNEELTTSKEEMQSMNEELQTLNHELQAKLDELSRSNDDMRNLLDSTDIATLFLDDSLRVRRFTAQMTKIIKLIPGDVNRPISDLASDLVYSELAADSSSVLRTLVFKERPVTTLDGRWFSVRIMPYRTLDNRIDGVVITFVDITASKVLESTLRKTQAGGVGES